MYKIKGALLNQSHGRYLELNPTGNLWEMVDPYKGTEVITYHLPRVFGWKWLVGVFIPQHLQTAENKSLKASHHYRKKSI